MPYTYNKLKGRITELYGTQGNFAKKVGISKNSMSKKLTCKTEFSQGSDKHTGCDEPG